MRILQTDVGLPELVQKYGCNWRSCLGVAETHLGRDLDLETLQRAYDECVSFGFMNDHCLVSDPGKIISWGLRKLDGSHLIAYYVATSSAPGWTLDWYGWIRAKKAFCVSASTLCGLTPLGNEHWREGDAGGHEIWNPHSTATLDKELRKVYFRIEERW